MKELNIEKFSPKKAELQTLAENYKNLTINGVKDSAGYQLVDTARKDLKKKRVEITNTGKAMRQEARDFASAVIKAEKELVAIIEPLEKELKDKQEKIDQEKERKAREVLLPDRKEKLLNIGVELTDEILLGMESEVFNDFLLEKKAEYLEEKELKLEEEKKRIADEEAKKEAEAQRQKELEKVKEEAVKKEKIKLRSRRLFDIGMRFTGIDYIYEVNGQIKMSVKKEKLSLSESEFDKIVDVCKKDIVEIKKDLEEQERKLAEEDKKKALEEAKKKAEKEKQDIIDEQKRKDDERIAKEKADKNAELEKKRKEKEEKEKMEKRKAFVKWLADNGYNEETKDDFYRIDTTTESVLYKKISTFKI